MRKKIIIFDLDGTLVDITQRLHFIEGEKKDWNSFFDACDKDLVKQKMKELCLVLYNSYTIYIVTGRPERIRNKTEKFLNENNIFFHKLLMRKDGDHRKDYFVKKRIYDKFSEEEKDGICFVFEDRKTVVDMWRSLGLICFQVADGNF